MKNGIAHDSARMFLRTETGAAFGQDDPTVLVVRPVAQKLTIVVQDDVGRDRALVTVTESGEVTIIDHEQDQAGDSITIAVTLEVEVNDNDVNEVMQEAFSGGINYWADEGPEHPSGGWEIYDRASSTRHEIGLADVRRAIRAIASENFAAVGATDTVHGDVLHVLQSSADGFDFVLIDAAAADQIVQVAALGRVIHS